MAQRKVEGARAALDVLPTLAPYQKVKRLKLVESGEGLRDNAGMLFMGGPYHHVNTPDISAVIECVKDALTNGVGSFKDDPEEVRLYGG